MDYASSTQLSLKTREGDQVMLSIDHQRHYSESFRQYTQSDGSAVQEFSVAAKTASRYSLVVHGQLNQEEMSAITQLAQKLSPMAKDFLNQNNGDAMQTITKQADLPSVIEKFQLSIKEQSHTRSTNEGNPGPSGDSKIRNLPALMSALLDSIFMSIVAGMRDNAAKVLDSPITLPATLARTPLPSNALGNIPNPVT